MKIIFTFLTFAFAFSFEINGNDAILGEWFTSDKKGKVQIYECGSLVCGKISWLKDPPPEYGDPPRDVNNPDVSLRNRLLLGMNILQGFKKTGDNHWENGTIYDPKNGKIYKCNMTLENDVLKVRGYIGFSLLGRTEEWTRVN